MMHKAVAVEVIFVAVAAIHWFHYYQESFILHKMMQYYPIIVVVALYTTYSPSYLICNGITTASFYVVLVLSLQAILLLLWLFSLIRCLLFFVFALDAPSFSSSI